MAGTGDFLLPSQQKIFGEGLKLLHIRDGADVAAALLKFKFLSKGQCDGIQDSSSELNGMYRPGPRLM